MTDARRIAAVLRDFSRGAGTRLTVLAVVTSLAAGAAAVSVSLWLKLIIDGAADGEMTEVTVLAIALGATVTVQASAASMSVLYLARLQFACGVQLVCRIMQAAGGSPGIEHYERAEYADRISLLKSQTNYISGFLPVLGDGLALAGRVAITAVLLAGVHPALLLLPLLALPSVWAGTRAERVVNAANVATAQQGRLEAHLFGLSTTASPAKEVRVFGLGAPSWPTAGGGRGTTSPTRSPAPSSGPASYGPRAGCPSPPATSPRWAWPWLVPAGVRQRPATSCW